LSDIATFWPKHALSRIDDGVSGRGADVHGGALVANIWRMHWKTIPDLRGEKCKPATPTFRLIAAPALNRSAAKAWSTFS
jgi:hypothetical protein